ncbi:hypothetical protein QH494_06340 [Sphingomonas sp. AR_OL41]|uniref:hypothetical protein n=1 Tax=Sphingomonas sp. AR_OL41 TaxID=3042729 RepID=UPI002480B3F4|nr:hypothetical protein [Sphingomonas sp. AR_OL41]MDH7971798.1 hypothetical protein [Sphingomonas sp. AR_OL41]
MQRMLAERNAREQPPAPAREKDDPILAKIEQMAPFVDEGWAPGMPGQPVRPSTMMGIRYCAVVTSPDAGAADAAFQMALRWLNTARRRWRAGYCANPFGEPVRRR